MLCVPSAESRKTQNYPWAQPCLVPSALAVSAFHGGDGSGCWVSSVGHMWEYLGFLEAAHRSGLGALWSWDGHVQLLLLQ